MALTLPPHPYQPPSSIPSRYLDQLPLLDTTTPRAIQDILALGRQRNHDAIIRTEQRSIGFTVKSPGNLGSLGRETEATWCQVGSCFEAVKKSERALEAYEQALQHNPTSMTALTAIATISRTREEYSKATEYFARVLALQEDQGDIWGALGHCYLMMDDLPKAYGSYQQALIHMRNPREPKLWYGIGILYDRYGSLDHAEEAFSSVIKMDPNFDKANEIYFRLGIIYKQQRKPAESLECFKWILNSPPKPLTQTDIWFQIGQSYETQEKLIDAKDAYDKVLAQNPNHARVLQRLGGLYAQPSAPFHSTEKAIEVLTSSIRQDNTDCFSWYLLGRAYMTLTNYNQAYEAYQQAVYREPRNPAYWCSIGVLYYIIMQHHDALDAYSRAIRTYPYMSEVWFNLGTLYEACNDQLKDATDAYERALKLEPEYNKVEIERRVAMLKEHMEKGRTSPLPHPPQPRDIQPGSSSWKIAAMGSAHGINVTNATPLESSPPPPPPPSFTVGPSSSNNNMPPTIPPQQPSNHFPNQPPPPHSLPSPRSQREGSIGLPPNFRPPLPPHQLGERRGSLPTHSIYSQNGLPPMGLSPSEGRGSPQPMPGRGGVQLQSLGDVNGHGYPHERKRDSGSPGMNTTGTGGSPHLQHGLQHQHGFGMLGPGLGPNGHGPPHQQPPPPPPMHAQSRRFDGPPSLPPPPGHFTNGPPPPSGSRSHFPVSPIEQRYIPDEWDRRPRGPHRHPLPQGDDHGPPPFNFQPPPLGHREQRDSFPGSGQSQGSQRPSNIHPPFEKRIASPRTMLESSERDRDGDGFYGPGNISNIRQSRYEDQVLQGSAGGGRRTSAEEDAKSTYPVVPTIHQTQIQSQSSAVRTIHREFSPALSIASTGAAHPVENVQVASGGKRRGRKKDEEESSASGGTAGGSRKKRKDDKESGNHQAVNSSNMGSTRKERPKPGPPKGRDKRKRKEKESEEKEETPTPMVMAEKDNGHDEREVTPMEVEERQVSSAQLPNRMVDEEYDEEENSPEPTMVSKSSPIQQRLQEKVHNNDDHGQDKDDEVDELSDSPTKEKNGKEASTVALLLPVDTVQAVNISTSPPRSPYPDNIRSQEPAEQKKSPKKRARSDSETLAEEVAKRARMTPPDLNGKITVLPALPSGTAMEVSSSVSETPVTVLKPITPPLPPFDISPMVPASVPQVDVVKAVAAPITQKEISEDNGLDAMQVEGGDVKETKVIHPNVLKEERKEQVDKMDVDSTAENTVDGSLAESKEVAM